MTRKIALLLLLPLLVPTSVFARNPVWMQLSGGATFAPSIDGAYAIDGPGINLGLGFGAYVARPLDLYLTFGYAYFPSTNDELPITFPTASANAVPPPSWSAVGEPFHALDTSFGVRVVPKGDRTTTRPYFLVGLGMAWLSRAGFPGSEGTIGDTTNDPYVAVGIGFEGPITGDTYYTFEIMTKTLVDRGGAYFPITAGVRF